METSAKSRGGRLAVPAKITSSMPPPRSDLGLDSPIAQRIASSRLDLPQPLGPTTPVSPRSILSSAGSTKLLNPESFSRLICIEVPPDLRSSPRARPLDQRLQLLPRRGIGFLAIDEEGRRVRHARLVRRLGHCEQTLKGPGIGQALPSA